MGERSTGWQPDGSYVPCPACRWEPTPHEGPGVPVRMPGTTHKGNCPTLPRLSPEAQRELQATLDEMDRMRRRAEVESRGFFIGWQPAPRFRRWRRGVAG